MYLLIVCVSQETDQLKLELQDIEREVKNTEDQITSLRDKISRDEQQLEQLTHTADAAKVSPPCLD